MITVSCVFVHGHVAFTREYVLRLRQMVARHLSREHRFVCLTDRPHQFRDTDIETVEISPPTYGVFAWWRKLHLFDASVKQLQEDRCLYLDLDTLVLRPLEEIIDFPAAFALVPDDAPNFKGKGPRLTVKKFNSSVMVWNGGEQNALFNDFRVAVSRRLWGDQDWIGEQSKTAVAMPVEWFPRVSQCVAGPPDQARVVLCKKPKNYEAAKTIPWVKEAWQ